MGQGRHTLRSISDPVYPRHVLRSTIDLSQSYGTNRPHCLLKTGSNKKITTVKRNLNNKLQVSNGEIHFTHQCVNLVTHTNFTAICVTEADF